jgi:hypothetical protein
VPVVRKVNMTQVQELAHCMVRTVSGRVLGQMCRMGHRKQVPEHRAKRTTQEQEQELVLEHCKVHIEELEVHTD